MILTNKLSQELLPDTASKNFIKDKIYCLPNIGEVKFIEKAKTNYSIDLYDFEILSKKDFGLTVRVLASEVQELEAAWSLVKLN